MINLTPIAANIQRRLFEKMRVLGRDPESPYSQNPGMNNSKDTRLGLTHAKMATRSTFIRMCSGQINPVVLHGGKLKDNNNIPGGYDEIYGPRTYFTEETIGNTTSYNKKVPFSNKNKRPMPGVKSADISFKGGVRALREATVQWTCWDWDELNILMPHFLAHGKTVLLEWGWVYDANHPAEKVNSFIDFTDNNEPYINATAYDAETTDKIIDANGDFDMMVGIIKNFEFTTRDDGGFDCSTIISSVGASILDNPEPNASALDPGIVYNTSIHDTGNLFEMEDLSAKLTDAVGEVGEVKEKYRVGGPNVVYREATNDANENAIVDLNTTLSLKLFIKNIEKYIITELANNKSDNQQLINSGPTGKYGMVYQKGTILHEPNKYIVGYHGDPKDIKDKTLNALENVRELPNFDSATWNNKNTSGTNFWVRWGWFEDNILSKFLSMVSTPQNKVSGGKKYPEVMTEFRSIEMKLDTEQKSTGKYESVRIKNHAELQTTNILNHILPGQFYPADSKPYTTPSVDGKKGKTDKIPGDNQFFQALAKTINRDFDSFATETDKFEIGREAIYEPEAVIKAISEDDGFNADFSGGGVNSEAADVAQKRKQIGERIIYSDTDIPGKYGYLRNMLINTKVIKAAFGVGDDFNVESINVVESLESLFSMLNRDLNFWNFSIITDAKETYRAKIIDEQVVNFEFDRNNPVTKQKSIGIGNDLVTPEGYGTGVFFFPVWRQDSLVKRQNITAKIPDAMQLAVMYGTNFDQLKDLANPGAAFGNKEGVFAGALFNQYADIKNQGADIAFRTETKNRLGTKNGDANEKLSNDGDDIRTFIKKHTGDLELKLEDRLAAINEELNLVDEPELFEGLDFDPAKPPPVIRNLNAEQLGELLQHEKKLGYGTGESDKPLGSLLGSTFQNTGQMKSFFKKSVRFLTTQHGIYKQGNTPLLIPLELELDIDGIGGIYPGNSCHSTYVPQKYQEVTVFQIFDVNHRIGNEGWTVTLASKMRSNLDSVMDGFYTLDELRQQQFKNYFDKATMNERKRLNEIELNEQRMKEIEKKYPGAYGD